MLPLPDKKWTVHNITVSLDSKTGSLVVDILLSGFDAPASTR